jgi:hypothetical protein
LRTRNIVITVDSTGRRHLGLCKQDRNRFSEMLISSVVMDAQGPICSFWLSFWYL